MHLTQISSLYGLGKEQQMLPTQISLGLIQGSKENAIGQISPLVGKLGLVRQNAFCVSNFIGARVGKEQQMLIHQISIIKQLHYN
jgi:hypothetical protein